MESNITFQDLGLSEAMLKALEKKGYGYPTTIQAEAIPHFMQWKDVIAKAPTGTGKTFAFGIPMIEHIDAQSEEVQGLILAPTRELAIQIGDELRGLLTYYQGIRVAVIYLILSAGLRMLKKMKRTPFSVTAVAVTVILMLTCTLLSVKLSTIVYILAGGGMGVALWLVRQARTKAVSDEKGGEA